LKDFYDDLSESAHPNFEGTCMGYSTVDHDNYVTKFSNRWAEIYGDGHVRSIQKCMELFEAEYNEVWKVQMEQLEVWIEANDSVLEATKPT
jgi:hypothetical protein